MIEREVWPRPTISSCSNSNAMTLIQPHTNQKYPVNRMYFLGSYQVKFYSLMFVIAKKTSAPKNSKMTSKEILEKWIEAFNSADVETISNLYSENAINHLVVNEPVIGKKAIKKMFADEFANADMVCIPENIFQDGNWVILEWKDPNGLRGCGFLKSKITS